jgi:pyrimidine-specific ribonucleoside hydrolase
MMKRLLGIILGLLIMQLAFSHYRARYHVIIDTDGGVDDFRAICMLLASPEIEVIAITSSDGILGPAAVAEKVKSLLHSFGHDGIPVGLGVQLPGSSRQSTAAYELAGKIRWGKDIDGFEGKFPGAVELILESVENEEMPVDFLALGSMTNIAAAYKCNPGLVDSISKITWYREAFGEDGFNYETDPVSAKMIEGSGFSLDLIHSSGSRIHDAPAFLLALDTIRSEYAGSILNMYESGKDDLLEHKTGLYFADDCIPLYFTHPEIFKVMDLADDPLRREISPVENARLELAMLTVLDSDREDKSIIFKRFPISPDLFEEDVSQIADQIIEKHGLKEWKLVAMTNEFHEHLGIYSIIGAKMGLRAREYFHIGIDELTIESFAGSIPPVSCLNDGLQSSTGATLGHGTIKIRAGDPSPEATFTFKNSTIHIRVKDHIRNQISEDVKTGVREYGLDSPLYWLYIRELALKYWLNLDRREIFEISRD